jgi:hypothetical protein
LPHSFVEIFIGEIFTDSSISFPTQNLSFLLELENCFDAVDLGRKAPAPDENF